MQPHRTPYSTAAFWIATIFGGPLAAAWLARANRLSANSTSRANKEVLLWVAGIVACWISYRTPPDLISQQLSTGLFSYLAVGIWLLISRSDKVAAGQVKPVPLWHAFGVGMVTKFAVLGFLLFVSSITATGERAFDRWSQQAQTEQRK